MAIKERKYSEEEPPDDISLPKRRKPVLLTVEETASLHRSLEAKPGPLSPEINQAIANYKRLKAQRI